MAPPTQAQLKEIEGRLFLFNASPPALPKPANIDNGTNPVPLVVRMIPVATDARFEKISFGVVEFQADVMKPPSVFLHKANKAWRMGSAGKIAILLAAAQLRDDVRKVKAIPGLVMSPAEFDDVFSTIWSRSKVLGVKEIAGKDGCPRVSTTIDVTQSPPDFIGAHFLPNRSLGRTDMLPHPWSALPDISFWDRLWLAGAQSDNVSATSCVSEIGVAYIKEVQKAYGLWIKDPKKGMHMLLADGYWNDTRGDIPKTPVSRVPKALKHRILREKDKEKREVSDSYFDPTDSPTRSYQAGSVAALTAYMIALIQDKLVDKAGCDTIKTLLADGVTPTLPGSLIQGVQGLAPTVKIDKAHGKGGALKAPPSKDVTLRCDLAYIETAGSGGSAGKKYAIVAQGLVPFKDGADSFDAEAQGKALAQAIHNAL